MVNCYPQARAEQFKNNFPRLIEYLLHPFLYDIDILVNPDPAGNVNTGIGMRFSGLNYSQIYQFLSHLRDEINAALREQVS